MDCVLNSYQQSREKKKENACHLLSVTPNNFDIAPNVHEKQISLSLMLYVPEDNDYITNRVVAFVNRHKTYDFDGNCIRRGFAHVELSFEHDIHGNRFFPHSNQSLGFSINQFSDLYLKHKEWRNQYVCQRITVSIEQYRTLLQICTMLASQKIGFDSFGMYSAPFMMDSMLRNRTRATHGTFCSRIIAEVLQEVGIGNEKFKNLKPWRATPNILANIFS